MSEQLCPWCGRDAAATGITVALGRLWYSGYLFNWNVEWERLRLMELAGDAVGVQKSLNDIMACCRKDPVLGDRRSREGRGP